MIYLRLAHYGDLPLIMAWRSNPLNWHGFFTQKEPLEWKEHLSWYSNRNQGWRELIITLVEDSIPRDIGLITIGQLDHWSPEIGVIIGETSLWNKGYGTEAINLALNWLREYSKEHRHVVGSHSTILDNNKPSIKAFKKCGFKYLGKAREGESWYQRQL